MSEKVEMLKSIQSELMQSKKELAAKEISLQKTCEELNTATTRMAQDRERVKTPTTNKTTDSEGGATAAA